MITLPCLRLEGFWYLCIDPLLIITRTDVDLGGTAVADGLKVAAHWRRHHGIMEVSMAAMALPRIPPVVTVFLVMRRRAFVRGARWSGVRNKRTGKLQAVIKAGMAKPVVNR